MSGVCAGSSSFSPSEGANRCAADAHSNNTISHSNSTCYDSASWFSQLVFGWLSPLLKLGNAKGQLDMADLQSHLPLPEQDTALHVNHCFNQAWRREQEKSRAASTTATRRSSQPPPSLAKAMWMAFHPDFVKAAGLKLIHDLLQFVGPQVLRAFITLLRSPSSSTSLWYGLLLTAAVTGAQLGMSLCLRHYFFHCYRVGLRVRSSVVMAVYQKALRRQRQEAPSTSDGNDETANNGATNTEDASTGEISNLMSVDAQRLQDMVTYLHALWYSWLQIGVAIYFLWKQLGISCLAGVGVIVLCIPLTVSLASYSGTLQTKVMKFKDERVELNNEILSHIKVVKLQAWEVPFQRKLMTLRQRELRGLLLYLLTQVASWLLYTAVPVAIAVCTFAFYVISGEVLDVATALTSLALFDILRFPLFMLPMVIHSIVEASVSLGRIERFLMSPDHEPVPTLESSFIHHDHHPIGIEIRNATFSHDARYPLQEFQNNSNGDGMDIDLVTAERERLLSKPKHYGSLPTIGEDTTLPVSESSDHPSSHNPSFALRDITLSAQPGEMIAVVGAVGSGKSTLLRALLGEIRRLAGDFGLSGSVAYFDQTPFILNDTVQGNILFGKPLDNEDLYQQALECCALAADLKLLPNGDKCEIGEKGITLSGGQKARIAMARVVYHSANIILLDDPLAAVDAHVGRHLFDQCIVDTLLQNKVQGSNGVTANGIKRSVVLVTNALQYLSHPLMSRIVVLKDGVIVEIGTYNDLLEKERSYFKEFLSSFHQSMIKEDENDDTFDSLDDSERDHTARKSTSPRHGQPPKDAKNADDGDKVLKSALSDEYATRETGKVGLQVYLEWAEAAGGTWIILPIIAFFILGQGMSVLANWWLTYWSHAAGHDDKSQIHFLGIYGIIALSAVVADFLRMAIVTLLGLQAARTLFSKMLDSILRAPMSYFDVTPVGSIVNRCSRDIYTLEESLPESMATYFSCLCEVISTLLVVTYVTPVFAVMLLPILYFYRRQQVYFTLPYRELKRLDSISRSPIYSLFGETLDGVITIRAFSMEHSFMNRMVDMLDRQQQAYFLTFTAQCWLAVRLELIGTLIIFGACLAAVLEHASMAGNDVFAGLAGLSISYALSVTQSLNWMVRVASDFEANFIAVERIKQYCDLQSEPPRDVAEDSLLPTNWPDQGRIEFRNAKLRYRPELPLVLKGLNLTIPSHCKVGIVGRTGAGKSTLMTALLRLVELDGGDIILDGVDIKTVGLRPLRSKIAVIPQDPVLFSGSIRSNLDPFDEFDDGRLSQVLEKVGLRQENTTVVKSLQDRVLEGGSNFSVGQRQLLVIARALLCGASVVICDEATSAVDAETDARIQRVLRDDFKDTTCLTIAHRLNTIMDSDYILVMSDGQAVEFDAPQRLLNRTNSVFKDLVDQWSEDQQK